MNNDIGYLHRVGHVVRDMEQARDLYRKLGFLCPASAYPTLSRNADEPAKPFGAANLHASFARNFVEILAVVTEESHLPDDAHPISLQVPPEALPRLVESIEQTITKISASRLGEILPGETAPALPAFVAYAVAVRDPGSTCRWLENNGLTVNAEPSGGIFVPAKTALGAAVIFRQVEERS